MADSLCSAALRKELETSEEEEALLITKQMLIVKNEEGLTPIDIAYGHNSLETYEYLCDRF